MASVKKTQDCFIRIANKVYPKVEYDPEYPNIKALPRGEPVVLASINKAKKHTRGLMKTGEQIRTAFD